MALDVCALTCWELVAATEEAADFFDFLAGRFFSDEAIGWPDRVSCLLLERPIPLVVVLLSPWLVLDGGVLISFLCVLDRVHVSACLL